MITLIKPFKLALIILTILGGVVVAPAITQAMKIWGNVPNYCSAKPLTVTKSYASSKIDQYGKMDPELKAKIVKVRNELEEAGCQNFCGWHTVNIFNIIENGKRMFNDMPTSEKVHDFVDGKISGYEVIKTEFGNTVYAKDDLTLPQLLRELRKLPNNDNVYVEYYDYRDYLEVEAGRQAAYIAHAFNIVKDPAGNSRILTTTTDSQGEMISVFENMPLNKEFFQNPETLSKLFIQNETLLDVLAHYKFDIVGINREVSEATPDIPLPGNEGPEGEHIDSPEEGRE